MREGTVQPDGKRVKRLRIERGLSQEELAAKIGCSKRTIENIEGGKPVYLGTIGEIAEGLNVEINDLLLDETAVTSIDRTDANPVERVGNAPSLPALLVGRENDQQAIVTRIVDLISREQRPSPQVLTTVRGWPGVGKTAIARAIAHDVQLMKVFPHGVLWVSLGPSPSILSELLAWGRAVRTPELALAKDVSEASRRLAGILQDRRMVLIVDDVWDASHVQPFAVGGRHCAMLVTTRLPYVSEALASSPDDVYRLDVLSAEASLELLETLAPQAVTEYPNECRELIRELEGLPLALQVAGRMLRAERAHGWSVAKLLHVLREDAAKILAAEAPADMAAMPGDVTPSVAALLHKSTDCLDPMIRKRFAFLAPFAPRPAMFELEDMMAVWKVDEGTARKTVDVLVDRGLLEPIGKGEYQIHQVLVQHAKTLLPKRG